MRLHPDWRQIRNRAWSVRFMALSIVFEIVNQVVVPYFQDYGNLPPRIMSGIAGCCVALGLLSRFVAQKEL